MNVLFILYHLLHVKRNGLRQILQPTLGILGWGPVLLGMLKAHHSFFLSFGLLIASQCEVADLSQTGLVLFVASEDLLVFHP